MPYTTDPGVLQKAQTAVHMAQLEIVVKDKEILELLPPMFRRDAMPQMMPAPGFDTTRLRTELERLDKEIESLRDKDDDGSKARLQALDAQRQSLKRQLRAAEVRAEPDAQGDVDATKQKPEPPKGEQPKTDQPKTEPPKSQEPPK